MGPCTGTGWPDRSTTGCPGHGGRHSCRLRGDATAAQTFLEIGKDAAFGLGRVTLERFANDIWHTQLRADDGSHPLPDEDHKRGSWSKVTGRSTNGGDIQFVLEGDIPVDSPLVDVVPDPHVVITLTLTVSLDQGRLMFEIDTDIDTGLLGDLFGGLVGAAAGAIVGLIVGISPAACCWRS